METIDVTIEIPLQGGVKYEIQKCGKLRVDRILSTSMVYPGNYGFIENTLACDGDPLDVLIINNVPFFPGSVVSCRVLGALITKDEKGMDEKIIAVPCPKVDKKYKNLEDLEDISKEEREKISHFFENYKILENGKFVEVQGFKNREFALQLIQKSFLV